jgi:hypothetical protein
MNVFSKKTKKMKKSKKKKQIENFFFYLLKCRLSIYLSLFSMSSVPASASASTSDRVIIKSSQGFNKCGIRNYLLYIPAFKNRDDTTVENVIPHWTGGLKSFFIIPQQFNYEWFCYLVGDINEPDMDCGTSATHKVYRDGDSFIQNVLTPNVVQICKNVCIPRDNIDGSLIEMFIAGAKMSTSEAVLKIWQTLVRETIKQIQIQKEEDEEME